jgi:hypothetical protein
MELVLDLALIFLLAATLFHALRLERALGVLKRDRAALEELVASFNSSTQMAEQGIERLRSSAEGAGRQITKQIERAAVLKDDLHFLGQRGEALADRLETAIRSSRAVLPEPAFDMPLALPQARLPMLAEREPEREPVREFAAALDIDEPQPRLRSQAERDLLKALRMAR